MKDLTTLKAALKILKKGRSGKTVSCPQCSHTLDLIADEIKANEKPDTNAHFEEQRIHDLKIDIDAVRNEAIRLNKTLSDDSDDYWLTKRLANDLKWFKTLL